MRTIALRTVALRTVALRTTAIDWNRWLTAAVAVLMSALVIAAQPGEVPSYDDLLKGSIYDTSGNWRSTSEDEYDGWREPPSHVEGRIQMGTPSFEEMRARQYKPPEEDPFEYDNAAQGYRVFKIDI